MKISLLGVKWDRYQCFRVGSSKGIELLRQALLSDTTELKINGVSLYDSQVQNLGDIEPNTEEELISMSKEKLASVEGIPVVLGGSHAITFGPVKAIKPDNFVIIDAHCDLYPKTWHEPEWMKHPAGALSQENVSWCINESGVKVHLYGQRVFSEPEEQYMKEKSITVSTLEQLKQIKGSIYLSIDFDCLDPAIIPAVGNPEPSGLTFLQVIEAVRQVADRIVAVDFVEFTPFPEDETGRELNKIYSRLAAKLIWSVLAEIKKAQT